MRGDLLWQVRLLKRARPPAHNTLGHGAKIFEVSWHQGIEGIARTAASWRPDILHLHSFWLWPIAAECLTQWVGQEAVISSADRVIALTQSERELLKSYCPGVDARVRVVGNGIDDIKLTPKRGNPVSRAPLVLFNGRFVERKGIRELIDAIEMCSERNPRFNLSWRAGILSYRGTTRKAAGQDRSEAGN
jgi:glycosyltransferase involved in cell wall biosynthesis